MLVPNDRKSVALVVYFMRYFLVMTGELYDEGDNGPEK